jgi:hypothetical protein
MKKTANHSPNYTDGGKNRPVVEMLLPFSVFRSFGRFFPPVFRRNEKITEFVEITPVEYAKSLGILGVLVSLVRQFVI